MVAADQFRDDHYEVYIYLVLCVTKSVKSNCIENLMEIGFPTLEMVVAELQS